MKTFREQRVDLIEIMLKNGMTDNQVMAVAGFMNTPEKISELMKVLTSMGPRITPQQIMNEAGKITKKNLK